MIRRWHHGHSTLTGIVIGVLLTRHSWLLFALGLCCGFALAYLRQSVLWFRDKVTHWREFGPSRLVRFGDGPTPVYRVPRPRPDDTIPY